MPYQSFMKGIAMRPDSFKPPIFRIKTLAVCTALLLACATAAIAQEAGGDLGGGAIVFRPRNPETTSKRRTNPNRRPTGGGTARVGGRPGARPVNPAAAAEL